MAEASIPVDLFNPGQVFACLGFLEAADVLCGDAEGGFDWSEAEDVKFYLRAAGDENPFEVVLQFLAGASVKAVTPEKWRSKKDLAKEKEPENEKDKKKWKSAKKKLEETLKQQEQSETFPNRWPDTDSAMPVRLNGNDGQPVGLEHWADGSSRNDFKLYAGNRSAFSIATEMRRGIAQLWKEEKDGLIKRPFDAPRPMRGSFNFDPQGGWTTIDAGYSPNKQEHKVAASPVVELLAAWGLENARPNEFQTRQVRYAAWGVVLPPILARVAFIHSIVGVPVRRFHFKLNLSGKNKVVTFAEEETNHA